MFEIDVNVKITMRAGKSIVTQICKFVIKYLSEIKQSWISSSWGKRNLAECRPTNKTFDCFTLCMVTYKMLTLKSRCEVTFAYYINKIPYPDMFHLVDLVPNV